MATQQFALEEVRAFVDDLHELGIHPQQVILFGSFARNEQREWSDIDVAIVAEEFSSFRPENSGRMSPALWKHADIEPHSFRPEDFTDWNPFVAEILRTGIRVV
ncbi:nucleotidyltransferase domain-containing protein [Hymenobacter caeli]|uniref:Nucleotidyltransferase n=1 Tax=Hymenobacter caeli TaxID=2735894 RepID=A0ABX2FM79_9BACT|nr:nucleotidyltransferase domain-containing protein [Hymenobacter caeli]NRT18250.1 putative nucleotidyltransferase [Hymenobacter caeli]